MVVTIKKSFNVEHKLFEIEANANSVLLTLLAVFELQGSLSIIEILASVKNNIPHSIKIF